MEETALLKHILSQNASIPTLAWLVLAGVKTPQRCRVALNVRPNTSGMDLLLTFILLEKNIGEDLSVAVATNFAPGPAWEFRGWL